MTSAGGIRALAALVGLGIIGCVAHAAVMAAGGYGSPAAPMIIALAAGLAAGALAVGVAWDDGRRSVALGLAGALFAGEAYALLLTAERTVAHREEQQAPLRAAGDARAKADERVMRAEAALTSMPTSSPWLLQAEGAKKTADQAVVDKSAEKGCKDNCRQLLQAQVDAAAKDVALARAELDAGRDKASEELAAARADLASIKAPPSATPLADRLGIAGWTVDLAAAALASIAANGLAALLLAFAAHGRRREVVIDVTPAPVAEDSSEPVGQIRATRSGAEARNANEEADLFARTSLRPAERGRVKLAEIPAAYAAWCRERGLDPLPQKDIGAALSALFSSVGLYKRGSGARAVVPGIEWRSRGPLRIGGPASNAASP